MVIHVVRLMSYRLVVSLTPRAFITLLICCRRRCHADLRCFDASPMPPHAFFAMMLRAALRAASYGYSRAIDSDVTPPCCHYAVIAIRYMAFT